jgi:hypothetical protein
LGIKSEKDLSAVTAELHLRVEPLPLSWGCTADDVFGEREKQTMYSQSSTFPQPIQSRSPQGLERWRWMKKFRL